MLGLAVGNLAWNCAGSCMGGNLKLWLCRLVTTGKTLAQNDIIRATGQCSYPRYFGFAFFEMGGGRVVRLVPSELSVTWFCFQHFSSNDGCIYKLA